RRTATELPLLAFPGLERGVLTDRSQLAVGPGHRLLRIDEDFVVRTCAPRGPDFLAGVGVVRDQTAAHTEFTARNAGDDLVLEHMWRICVRLADLRVAILRGPHDLAGV